jgi:hypothetical protein
VTANEHLRNKAPRTNFQDEKFELLVRLGFFYCLLFSLLGKRLSFFAYVNCPSCPECEGHLICPIENDLILKQKKWMQTMMKTESPQDAKSVIQPQRRYKLLSLIMHIIGLYGLYFLVLDTR